MGPTKSYYDLRDALAEEGCPVCRLKAREGERYLDSVLYEKVNDPGVRRDVRQARGFCHRHGWQLVRPSASLGVAILHRDVIQTVLEALEKASFESPSPLSLQRIQESLDFKEPAAATAGLVDRLEPQQPCPACQQEAEMETIYVKTLLEHLTGEESLLDAFRSSSGLCLPHFRQALTLMRDEAVFEALVGAQQAICKRLEADLAEFIRKSDQKARGEEWGDERDAWLRAIAAVSGSRPEEEAQA
jgi:hypothetical protein